MKILYALISIAVVMIVLGGAVPVLWPLVTGTTDNITAMSGTDTGTTLLKSFWPVIILIIGLGMVVGIIMFGMRKFGLMSGGGLHMVNPLLLPVALPMFACYLAVHYAKTRKWAVFRK